MEGFGLKIPNFARVCMAWVLRGGVGFEAFVVATSISFPISTTNEKFKDWREALVSIKGEQVLSTVGGLEVGDCRRQNVNVFYVEGSVRWGVSKIVWDWVWDEEEVEDWAKGKIVSWKITWCETIVCLVKGL